MKQTTALKILKSGYNTFVTGSAGTGKTYLLDLYISYLKERRIYPTILAPTGIAASHLKGQTIHSYFSLGIRDGIDEDYLDTMMGKKYLIARYKKLKVLIIDEVSMISPEIFSSIDMILRGFKDSTRPFGGVQVVLSGDFFQLPPVSRGYREKRFAWQSPSWRDLQLKTCYLSEKFRQDDDKLINILDEIRGGQVSQTSYEIFDTRQNAQLKINFTPTKLYTHNVDVDRMNQQELDALPAKPRYFSYESRGSKSNIEKIFKSSLVLEELSLKKNAVVLFIKNNSEQGYVNGTTGVVVGFDSHDGMPIVKTSTGRKIKLELEDWSIENEHGKVIATVSQIPLRLAWAITIHKSQGMTLDAAEIDLTKTFEAGQGYVALSRIKNIEGLRLMGLNDMALTVDPLILRIDDRIEQASVRASDEIGSLSTDELEEKYSVHIKALGGLVEKAQIEDEKAKIESGSTSHDTYSTPTHIKTKQLIEKSNTIIELATNRGLSKSTVINHLAKIKDEDEKIDLSKFIENDKNLEEIKDAMSNIISKGVEEDVNDKGKVRLKPIFEALNGKISYDEIRIALLFV